MKIRRGPVAAICTALAAHVACDPTPTLGPSAYTASQSMITSIELSGVTRLGAIGESATLKVVATSVDGKKQDVTSSCRWSESNSGVVDVFSGLVKAVGFGRTQLTAECAGRSASTFVAVTPPGTFVLFGSVSEPGPVPVGDAVVEVVGGPPSSKTMTRWDGSYQLVGLVGNVNLRISKDGYVAQTHSTIVTQDTPLDVELPPITPPDSFAGSYRVTLQAAPTCSLPPEVMTRSYMGTIAQTGALLEVTLAGAQFVSTSSSSSQGQFSGHVSGGQATFQLDFDSYYGLYQLVEKISDTLYLGVGGTITATMNARVINATLVGDITTFSGFSVQGIRGPVSTCSSSAHRLTFVSQASPSRRRRG